MPHLRTLAKAETSKKGPLIRNDVGQAMNRESPIEGVLRSHPGIRDAAVVREGDTIRAFVVPDDAYLEENLGSAASTVLGKWRKVFDLSQFMNQTAPTAVGFNILGWNSSYTRQPIPAGQMHEWIASTVGDILPLAPKIVCELGCGTGLLLTKIAPLCERYIAVDFSPAALASLREQLRALPDVADRVQILERRADNFDGLDANSVDTVIINSVVQYFPSATYLTKVLQNAVNIVQDGGHVFVGDVMSLPLHPLFLSSVVLFQAADEVTVGELRDRIQKRIDSEPQLILSPAYFLDLPQRFPRISNVEIAPRRERADNEMSQYRYQVILHMGPEADPTEVEFLDWMQQGWSLEAFRLWLQQHSSESIGIKCIPNARVERDLEMLARTKSADAKDTAGKLRRDSGKLAGHGIHPRDLLDLGAKLNLEVMLSWSACRADASYDAVFLPKRSTMAASRARIKWPAPPDSEFTRLANAPGQSKFRAELIDQLLTYCEQRLPRSMVPDNITLVDKLVPTTE